MPLASASSFSGSACKPQHTQAHEPACIILQTSKYILLLHTQRLA